jgi:hypothetical protein
MKKQQIYFLIILLQMCVTTTFSQLDVKTERYQNVDNVIIDLYDVISGPAGERDWDRMKNLFHPNAIMGALRMDDGKELGYSSFTLEEYVERSGPYFLENGFFESELNRSTQQYGELIHMFSAYESRHTKQGPVFSRGINSIQLIMEKERWWIVSIQWNSEREDLPIPKKLK